MPELQSKLTVIVVTYNSMKAFPEFIAGMRTAMAGDSFQIIVCDNASQDGLAAYVAEHCPEVRFLASDTNDGYGGGLNRGISAAVTPYVALMNPDTMVMPGGLQNCVSFIEQNLQCAAVTGIVINRADLPSATTDRTELPDKPVGVHLRFETLRDRVLLYSGLSTRFFRTSWLVPWTVIQFRDSIQVKRIHGAFGVFSRQLLLDIGLFDPRFFLYFEEDDVAKRIEQRNHRIYTIRACTVVHTGSSGSSASGSLITDHVLLNSQYLFFRKHYGAFYCWCAFFTIWTVISMMILILICTRNPRAKRYISYWNWHLRSLLSTDRIPPGTIPDNVPHAVEYYWRKMKRTTHESTQSTA